MSDISKRLDAVIDGAIASGRIAGAVVLASRGDDLVYARAAGMADREAGIPMQENALFRLASVSKLYTATAAMILVERGDLTLDDPVTAWLSDFTPRFERADAKITLRHLLSHSAGLGYGFLEPADGPLHRLGVSDGMDLNPVSLSENVRRIAQAPLLFSPGTAFSYSLAIDVVGAIIEIATAQSLDAAIRALVTEPLGLKDTGFMPSDPSRLAAAYTDGTPKPRRLKSGDTVPFLPDLAGLAMDPDRAIRSGMFHSGGAGMIGSAGDLLTLLNTLRGGGGPLMSPSTIAEMGRDQIAGRAIEGSPGWGYGLGFSVLRDDALSPAGDAAGAWRWGGAYGHSWLMDSARDLSLVAFTNTALEGMWNGGRFPSDLGRAMA